MKSFFFILQNEKLSSVKAFSCFPFTLLATGVYSNSDSFYIFTDAPSKNPREVSDKESEDSSYLDTHPVGRPKKYVYGNDS